MFGCLISTAAIYIGSKVREMLKNETTTLKDEQKWSVYLLVIVIYLLPISISALMYSMLYCHFKILKNNQIGIDNSVEFNVGNTEGKYFLFSFVNSFKSCIFNENSTKSFLQYPKNLFNYVTIIVGAAYIKTVSFQSLSIILVFTNVDPMACFIARSHLCCVTISPQLN
jgi:hypothetical protein